MRPIQDSRVSLVDGKWRATCQCGSELAFSTKASALNMVNRGTCRNCKRHYKNVVKDVTIYQNENGKWCSTCSGCGKEQAYTRKDHAKQSELRDWQCKTCVGQSKGFSSNVPVGKEKRMFNKYRKSANNRGIPWFLTFEEFIGCYNGKCALTGWDICMDYESQTASLDRIDSQKSYSIENIQWVHSMVNMCKNKYSQERFIEMCKAVADKAKW